jgi:TP901 family phage tail tape measure protein
MNIGEVLIRFGAETSGFMGGLRLVESAIGGMGGFVKGALGDMNSGLHSITSGFATMGTGAGGAFSSMRIGAQDVASGMLKLGAVIALVGGIAAVALGVTIGVVAVRAAGDFQQGMARLVTGAGDVTDNMQKMGQSILGISTSTGVLTGQLLPAMYQIISAGQRGADAENTLKVAAQGSVAEQAKIVDVAKALTTAMTDYGTSQFNATQFMNGYTRATQLGKITLEQLSTSMGPILPLAKNIGISFADVAGAMSTMTNAGIPAAQSATSLRFLFQSLEVPTTKAKNAMDSMGLSSVAVGNELKKSLPGALEMIYKAALRAGPEGSVPFNRAVSDMIGGQRSLQAYLALTGSHFATYSANARAVADAMNFSKTAVLGWDVAQQNFNTKLAQAQAALQAVFITIGSHLLPVLTQIVGQLVPIIQRFADWVTHTNAIENAIKAVAPIFTAFFSALMSVLPTVIGLFLKFMAVLGQLIAAMAGNKQGMEALILVAKVLGVLVVAVLAAGLLTLAIVFGMIALVIVTVITVVRALILAWNGLVAAANWVAGAWNSAIAFLVGLWHTLVAAATTAFNAVKNAIVSAFNATIAWIGGAWNSAIAFIVGIWNTLPRRGDDGL